MFSLTSQIGRARLNLQICRGQTAHLDISQPSSATPTGISPALFSRMVTSSGNLISHMHVELAHTRNLNTQSPTREHPASAHHPTMGSSYSRSHRAEPGAWKPLPTSEMHCSLLGPLSFSLLTHWRGTATVTELLMDGTRGLYVSSEPYKVQTAGSDWEAIESPKYWT